MRRHGVLLLLRVRQPGWVELTTRGGLRAEGYAEHEVRRMLREGALCPVGPGAYVREELPPTGPARHLLLVLAARLRLSSDAVVSHVSAAVLHGLPVWGLPLDRVHITRSRRRSGARRGARVHVHCADLAADEVVEVDGVRVTSVERTLVDLGRTVPFEQAVVVADRALHRHLTDKSALRESCARRPRWPGLPAARRVIGFADARSLNPGESRSRVAIAAAGLPAPVLQWDVRTAAGAFVARVDFGWPRLRTVGEFDGRVKYGRDLRPGQDPAELLYAEKLREDAVRAEDLGMVRWGWVDLDRFAPVADRLRRQYRLL